MNILCFAHTDQSDKKRYLKLDKNIISGWAQTKQRKLLVMLNKATKASSIYTEARVESI